MKKILILLLSFGVSAPFVCASSTYVGSLSTTNGGLVATGEWGEGSLLTWLVTNEGYGGNWFYQYNLVVPQKAISHIVIETSPSFTAENILELLGVGQDIEGVEFGTFVPGNSNPGMLGDLFGVKFDTSGDSLNLTIQFVSDRDPVWGDIYAKDGVDGSGKVYLYNSGFSVADPTDPASNGSISSHVLVPDTIPEPKEVILLVAGIILLSIQRYRYRVSC